MFVGRQAGGTGTLLLSGGSSLSADYIGVGSAQSGDSGGTGVLVLNNSSLTAGLLEIGHGSLVHGNGGVIVGKVINRGVFSPGNSPGTLVIDGDFVSAAGGKLELEVADDGHGGFITDHLVFTPGHAVDLSGLAIDFHFLGNANPTTFAAGSGLLLDNFLQARTGAGDVGLSQTFSAGQTWVSLLAGAQFSAQADHYTVTSVSFSGASGGVSVNVTAVPEPQTWLMLLGGLAWLGRRARRR